ncbi:MAG TPA: hypothetical protein PKN80_01540 [bacterium]|nr:hypothetical protein [bacterium]HNS48217.1 hypothetical protein [bacterium]
MAIARMERVHLFLPEARKEELIREMESFGLVEVGRLEPEEADLGPAEADPGREADETLNRLNYLAAALGLESGAEPVRLRESDLPELLRTFPIEATVQAVRRREKRLTALAGRDERLERIGRELEPFAWLDLPLKSLRGGGRVALQLVRVDRNRTAELVAGLDKIGGHAQPLAEEKNRSLLFVAADRRQERELSETLNRLRAETVALPAYRTSPAATLARLERLRERNRNRRRAAEAAAAEFRSRRSEILALLDHYRQRQLELEAKRKLAATGRTLLLTGWIRTQDRPRLEKFLAGTFPEAGLLARPARPEEAVPVALENGPVGQPFEAVVDLFGRPVYSGYDPSAFVAFFFILSFAFCLGDVGYGLLLALGSFLLMKKFPAPAARRLLGVFLYSGLATMLVGLLTNSWFGNLTSLFPPLAPLARFQSRLALFSPVDNPADTMKLFYFSLVVGFVQITTGMLLKAKEAIRRFGALGALEGIPPLVIQLGLPFLLFTLVMRGRLPWAEPAIPVTGLVLGVAALLIIYYQWRTQSDLVLKIFFAPYTLYGLVVGNLLGDTLSYARIFALGLTGGLLAVTVNQLAGMTGAIPVIGTLFFLLLLLGGHAFNLFISTLGAYVHTSRLQYLEFFTKFYESGGRPFDPLRKQYRYLQPDGNPAAGPGT